LLHYVVVISLIIVGLHVSGGFCFSDINIAQDSVATRLKCGEVFYYLLLQIYC